MKYWISLFILLVSLLPSSVFGACAIDGVTVVYVNGMLTSKRNDADLNKKLLKDNFEKISNRTDVTFLTGYNPSHLAGAGDLIQATSQLLGFSISNYDLNTILLQIHPQVTTRKILLLGHSQGTFYTNEIYNYLINNGVPKESVGVYNVATPASFVSGDGKYVTSQNDKVINAVRNAALGLGVTQPLPANISIPLTQEESAAPFGGHSFSGVYLANDSVRIVSDVENAIKKLVAAEVLNADDGSCFISPAKGLVYYAQKSVFSVADVAVTGALAIGEITYNGALATLAVIQNGVGNIVGGFFANVASVFVDGGEDGGGDSNLKLASEIDLNLNEEAAVIDNLAEEVQNVGIIDAADLDLELAPKPVENKAIEELTKPEAPITPAPLPVISAANSAGQGEVSAAACSFSTAKVPTRNSVIINEVAWMGGLNSSSDEWLELKNISGKELDISGWQIVDQSEQIKVKIPNGTKLANNKFFLLERTNDDTVSSVVADQIYTGALSNADEGLRLFDQNCNLADEVLASPEWPAGDTVTRQTMERKTDLAWQTSSVVSGTPKAENSEGLAQQSQAPAPEEPVVPEEPAAPAEPLKILISEVQITGGSGKTENDFIEFYNPNNEQVNLNGYRLVKRTKTGASDTGIKSWTDDIFIPAKGYYLWANSGYADIAVAPDVTTSATIANDNGVAIRFGAEDTGIIIDSVGWGTAQNSFVENQPFSENPIINQSLARKSENDTNNNAVDFIKSSPTPKNSQTSGGFLAAEEWSEPLAVISNFNVAYNSSTLGLSFSWDSIASTTYRLLDISDGATSTVIETKLNSTTKQLTEIGRDYKFQLLALNQSSTTIASAEASINAPSLLSNLAFYTDPRSATASPSYLLDFGLPQFPFTDVGGRWHVVVFYKNYDAPVTNNLMWLDYLGTAPYKSWGSIAPNGLKFNYPNCFGGSYRTTGNSLILPDASNLCSGISGNYASYALNWPQLEDRQVFLNVLSSNFASGTPNGQDFVTAAFYEYRSGSEPNNYAQRFLAIDKTRYYFQNSPVAHLPPDNPEITDAEFDSDSGALTLRWDAVSDSDSLDNSITYEITYGTTTVVTSATSLSLSVYLGESYSFSIKAKDEFGNYSASSEYTYDVPDLPLPFLSSVQWGHLQNPNSTILTIGFDNYPFMTSTTTPGAIVFFLNQLPPANYSFRDRSYHEGIHLVSDNSALKLSYDSCKFENGGKKHVAATALIFNDTDCPDLAAGPYASQRLLDDIKIGDTEATVEVTNADLGAEDFITMGFYKLGPRDWQDNANFIRVANYNKKIYFTD
ncbi:MAG: lamin tail domain-containing protein [bacterium]|nr:lamin tail domain-containing protein [bacterium]